MQYLFFALAAMGAWGVWAFLPKLASRIDPNSAAIWSWLGGSLIAIPCLICKGGRLETGSGAFGYSLAAGCCGIFGGLMYQRAMNNSEGNTSVVVVISALYPVVCVLMSYLLLREQMNAGKWAGLALCLAGAGCLAYFQEPAK